MNVTIIGDVCIDQNTSENTKYSSAGGASIFMNRIFNKFPEIKSTIISNYGSDFFPYLDHLAIYPPRPTSTKTLIYENYTRNNIRTQKVYNTDVSHSVAFDDEVRNLVENADTIVFAPLLPNCAAEYIKTILKAAKKEALTVLLPQGYFRAVRPDSTIQYRLFNEDESIIPLFDVIILSDEDYPDIDEITTKWLLYSNVKIIVTMGEKGARYVARSESFVVPTTPISASDMVDSVGAGDIFAASFIYKYIQSRDIRKSIEFGNRVAGWSLAYTPDQLETITFNI